jgi:hypothetical protein
VPLRESSADESTIPRDYNASMAVRNRVPVLAMLLCAVFLVYPLQAQISVRDLQALEGPWECRSPIGAAGIFITANTLLTQKSGQQDISSQSIDIRVYQRQGEQEHGGYFSPSTGLDGSTVFDGKRLIIHFKDRTDIPPFDLDVRFDPTAGHWTGSWSFCDKSLEVVLDRPRPGEGVHPSAFVGDWEGYSDPTTRFRGVPGTLHIRQGYDGGLTAWLDRTIQTDQRNGERLSVLSATQSAIVLGTVSAWGANYRYEGTLSGDGKTNGRPMARRRRRDSQRSDALPTP